MVLVSLLLAMLVVLRIWGISIVSLGTLVRSGATLAVLGGLTAVLLLLYGVFFRTGRSAYDRGTGNRAHPKR